MTHQQILDAIRNISALQDESVEKFREDAEKASKPALVACQRECGVIGHIFKPLKQGFFDSPIQGCIVCESTKMTVA